MSDDMSLDDFKTTVQTLRVAAQGRLRDDRLRLWPAVTDHDFAAIVNALGEISVVEARETLTRLQREALEARR